MNLRPPSFTGPALHRLLLAALAGAALLVAWLEMRALSQATRWYDKADVNIKNVADALALNSGVMPARIDQPGVPSQYLLALDYRLRHEVAGLRVWNLRRLDASADPIPEIAALVRLGRQHSRLMVGLCLLAAALLGWRVTRRVETACLAVVLLAGSSGLLFHGLLSRPELLAAGFGTVLAPLCLWNASVAPAGNRRDAWLFAAGLACGCAALAKLPGVVYVATSFAWCCAVARTAPAAEPAAPAPSSPLLWLLPLAASLGLLGVLHLLAIAAETPGDVALVRVRVVAAGLALLPLAALAPSPWRRGAFLRARLGELALLGGGALATLPLGYLLLRLVLPFPMAAGYLGELLQFVFHPGPALRYVLPATPQVAGELLRFVRESPFLFAGAVALAVATARAPAMPLRLKALVFLLLANGAALVLVLSRGRFADQYSLFAQVPFLLAWAFALHGFGVWRPAAGAGDSGHWAAPVVLVAALVLLATVYLRVRPKYLAYEAGSAAGISDVTVTYLYNHNALPEPYIAVMERHYGTRAGFVRALERELSVPVAPR